ncbi:unnamed protein product [Arctogadus glacialis]
MHNSIGDRPPVTPPVLIATCAQGAVVFTHPSSTTPERAIQAASTPKRRRLDVVVVLQELRSQDEQDWRRLQAVEREREEREERRSKRYVSRDGAWRCGLLSWILDPCCSLHAVFGSSISPRLRQVDRRLRHAEGPGDNAVRYSTGPSAQEHQAGDFWIPAMICVSPYGIL